MKHLHVLFLLLGLVAFDLRAGTLSATADRTQISNNETLTLTVQYDSRTDDEPDTSALEQQFTILSRNKTSSMQIINGDASSATTWYYELSPRKSGKLLIPSFNLNGDFSEAITIDVGGKTDAGTKSGQNIYTETLLDKNQVYVQQQVVVTWRLVSKVNISEPQFLPPQIDGALVQDLGSRAFQRAGADGNIERVIEQRYAIFPQQSGNLVIPSQQFQVAVDTSRRTGMGILLSGRTPVRLSTDEQSVTVTPAEKNKNTMWLPASSLEISQEVTGTNQTNHATAGTAFTRVIRIRAEGLSAEQLPPPDMQAPGIKVYSEKPTLENKANQHGVIGMREDRAAIIASEPGTLTLPAIKIAWYDVDAAQWREAVLPETAISVLPGAAPDQTTTNGVNAAAKSSTKLDDSNAKVPAPVPVPEPAQQLSPTSLLWPGISGALLLALTFIMIYVYRLRRRLKQTAPEGNGDTAPPSPRPTSTAMLQEALKQENFKRIHLELQAWAMRQPNSSEALKHPTLSPLVQALEKHLYGNGPAPSAEALKDLPAQLDKLAEGDPETAKKKPQLESLYC